LLVYFLQRLVDLSKISHIGNYCMQELQETQSLLKDKLFAAETKLVRVLKTTKHNHSFCVISVCPFVAKSCVKQAFVYFFTVEFNLVVAFST
jgi:hypothetical protein